MSHKEDIEDRSIPIKDCLHNSEPLSLIERASVIFHAVIKNTHTALPDIYHYKTTYTK